jgi:hypothetical protein
MLRSYYTAKFSCSSSHVDFSGIVGNAIALQHCVWLSTQGYPRWVLLVEHSPCAIPHYFNNSRVLYFSLFKPLIL